MSWKIDPSHSAVQFSVRHMMISTVRGEFDRFSGEVGFDEANPAATTVDVQIEADSINTRDAKRDGHLRSADFFDAEHYPTLHFKSTRVEVKDDTHARLIGDLTIRGVTHEVALDVEYVGQARSPWGVTSAGFSAVTRINRKDWGLNWNQALETGGVLVGDEIKIDIELELVEQVAAQAA